MISSCVFGESVRWNGTERTDKEIKQWAEQNNIKLIPVCPENELFGTPRRPIRLMQDGESVLAIMGERDVYQSLEKKSCEIAQRHLDAVGFIGIANSPSCGLAVGVKKRGSTMKASMHRALECPTAEISSMRSDTNRELFLRRIKKYAQEKQSAEDRK